MDKASPLIAEARAKGTRFPEATLTIPKGGGSQEYLEIKLTDVMISSYQAGGSQDLPTETFSLNFIALVVLGSEAQRVGPDPPVDILSRTIPLRPSRNVSPNPQKEPAAPHAAKFDVTNAKKAAPEQGRVAAAAVADLLPLNGLTVATSFIAWGQTATISTDDASSKQGGRCLFRYRYDTGNQGQAGAGGTTNRIHLDAANGPSLADDALPALAVGDEHTASGLLPLVVGTWTLYVHADDDLLVAEGDERTTCDGCACGWREAVRMTLRTLEIGHNGFRVLMGDGSVRMVSGSIRVVEPKVPGTRS